jgi:hypothetical protein
MRIKSSFQVINANTSLFPKENIMGRGILLWLLGVPIPVIILLLLLFHH